MPQHDATLYAVMGFALHRASGSVQAEFELRLAGSEDEAVQEGLRLVRQKRPPAAGWSDHQSFARAVVSVGVLLGHYSRGGAVEVARALLDLAERDRGVDGEGGEELKDLLM